MSEVRIYAYEVAEDFRDVKPGERVLVSNGELYGTWLTVTRKLHTKYDKFIFGHVDRKETVK